MRSPVAIVAGGAGFLGSRLCEVLLDEGSTVACLDDLSTGTLANLDRCLGRPGFTFRHVDVAGRFRVPGPVDHVFHLASPASPIAYTRRPVDTLMCGSHATLNLLRLAEEKQARFVLASTSEVYGDPAVHPQPETYFGNVNPTGPRSCYDEAKRFAEALVTAFLRVGRVSSTIARIFNTYGPRMRPEDGRVVSSFVARALAGEPLVVQGSGEQTRSLCYVDDTVAALALLRGCDQLGPFNIGGEIETSVLDIARLVQRLTGSSSPVAFVDAAPEDPRRRRPDLTRTRATMRWTPQVSLEDGLRRTIAWHHAQIAAGARVPVG